MSPHQHDENEKHHAGHSPFAKKAEEEAAALAAEEAAREEARHHRKELSLEELIERQTKAREEAEHPHHKQVVMLKPKISYLEAKKIAQLDFDRKIPTFKQFLNQKKPTGALLNLYLKNHHVMARYEHDIKTYAESEQAKKMQHTVKHDHEDLVDFDHKMRRDVEHHLDHNQYFIKLDTFVSHLNELVDELSQAHQPRRKKDVE